MSYPNVKGDGADESLPYADVVEEGSGAHPDGYTLPVSLFLRSGVKEDEALKTIRDLGPPCSHQIHRARDKHALYCLVVPVDAVLLDLALLTLLEGKGRASCRERCIDDVRSTVDDNEGVAIYLALAGVSLEARDRVKLWLPSDVAVQHLERENYCSFKVAPCRTRPTLSITALDTMIKIGWGITSAGFASER